MKPARIISYWSPILINRRHVSLCGEDQYGETWVSTTIAEIDLEAKAATTISGRPYKLYGEPDPDHALREALNILSRSYDLEGATVEAISLEAADAWLRGQPVKPSLSNGDKARNEQNRRRQTWAWLRFQAVESGLPEVQIADITGLPLDVIQSLHRGVEGLGEVGTDDAEEGLGRLKEWRGCGWRM